MAATPGSTPTPSDPVELHAIWARDTVTPVVRRVLDVIATSS